MNLVIISFSVGRDPSQSSAGSSLKERFQDADGDGVVDADGEAE
jgi:hypothetical protein